jgi:hypothetical protein
MSTWLGHVRFNWPCPSGTAHRNVAERATICTHSCVKRARTGHMRYQVMRGEGRTCEGRTYYGA